MAQPAFHFSVRRAIRGCQKHPCRGRKARLALAGALLMGHLWAPATAWTQQAGGITYQATDLQDVQPGLDLWQYVYNVSGFDFRRGQGFTIFFDPLRYSNLQNPPPPVNASWDVISVQPDVLLQAP